MLPVHHLREFSCSLKYFYYTDFPGEGGDLRKTHHLLKLTKLEEYENHALILPKYLRSQEFL